MGLSLSGLPDFSLTVKKKSPNLGILSKKYQKMVYLLLKSVDPETSGLLFLIWKLLEFVTALEWLESFCLSLLRLRVQNSAEPGAPDDVRKLETCWAGCESEPDREGEDLREEFDVPCVSSSNKTDS